MYDVNLGHLLGVSAVGYGAVDVRSEHLSRDQELVDPPVVDAKAAFFAKRLAELQNDFSP